MSSAQIERRALPRPSLPANPRMLAFVFATLFALTPAAAQTFSLIYQFKAGPDGSNPFASLIVDASGNLYGTTTIDGAYSNGTVFKVTPTGTETVLHNFTGSGGDGANPYGPLIRDSAGNLYGTTSAGGLYGGTCGANGCGMVFKLDPTGKETVLHRFVGFPADGQTPYQGLVRDSAGNLYGTTSQGGPYAGGIVFKLDPSGTETVLHSFNPNAGDGFLPFAGCLLRDSAGNLYGTTQVGGSQGAGTVFKLAPNEQETILHNFAFGTTDGNYPYGTLIADSAGNLFGVTNFGGAFSSGAVFKIDKSGNETLLYSFRGSGEDGAVPSGGLVRDSAGNLYGATTSGGHSYLGTIFKLTPSGTETILHSFSGSDGRLPNLGLVRGSGGNLYGVTQYGGAYGGGVVFMVTP